MTKVLRINDSGFVWDVPAGAIAKHRASYYAQEDKDTSFDDEFEFTMGNNYEIRDWFFNNMGWEDVAEAAQLVATPASLTAPRLNHDDLEAKVLDVPTSSVTSNKLGGE